MNTRVCPDKQCIYGGNPQSVDSFSKDRKRKDGISCYCKSCCGRRAKERMTNNPSAKAKAKEASTKYRNTKQGKDKRYQLVRTKEYREHANAYDKEYGARPEVKAFRALKQANYRTRNILKGKARAAAKYAINKGKIPIPTFCAWCGETLHGRGEAHHWRGYDPIFWLDVKIVHPACHDICENVMPEQWPMLAS